METTVLNNNKKRQEKKQEECCVNMGHWIDALQTTKHQTADEPLEARKRKSPRIFKGSTALLTPSF